MRIVVTGGAGFIGSAAVRMLVAERGATVLNIDKLTATSSLASLGTVAKSPRYSFRKTDVCDRDRVSALLHAFAPDAILHAAFDRQPARRCGDAAAAAIETNVVGTWHVLDAARDYWSTLPAKRQERFRFVSVSATAGQVSPVAAARAGADELVTAWHKSYGLPTLVSKAAETFGPFQFPNETLPATTIAAIDGASPEPQSIEPHAWVYVEDHVRALLAMIDKGTPGATYAVAGQGHINPAAIPSRVRELVERHGGRSHAPQRIEMKQPGATMTLAVSAGLNEAAVISSGRLERDTGWKPEETAETALSKTVRWYLANPAWWRPLVGAQSSEREFGILRIA